MSGSGLKAVVISFAVISLIAVGAGLISITTESGAAWAHAPAREAVAEASQGEMADEATTSPGMAFREHWDRSCEKLRDHIGWSRDRLRDRIYHPRITGGNCVLPHEAIADHIDRYRGRLEEHIQDAHKKPANEMRKDDDDAD